MASSKLSSKEQLKRIIYLSSPNNIYISGNPETYSWSKYPINLDVLDLNDKPEEFLSIIVSTSDCKFIPRRETLFYILALYAANPKLTPEVKEKITEEALKITKSDDDFFNYIKYSTQLRNNVTKISTNLRKYICKYYKNKTADKLADFYKDRRKCHGWSHKTLFKLCHIKTDTIEKSLIVKYILYKEENFDENINNDKAKELIQVIKNVDTVSSAKNLEDVLPIIKKLKLTHQHLSQELQKKAEAWNAVLPFMEVQDVLKVLPRLYKNGFLKLNSETHNRVVECLTDPNRVRSSTVNPVEVFIHLKNFEKGGKPIDPQLLDHLVKDKQLTEEQLLKVKTTEPKCQILIGTIHKCMSLSYHNVKGTGLKYLLTVDVTNKMDYPCLHSRNITAIEATLSLILFYLKTEQNVTVAVFKDKDVVTVDLKTVDSVADMLKKIKDHESTYLVPTAGLDWALKKCHQFDVFINFIHHVNIANKVPKELRSNFFSFNKPLEKYLKTVNKNAKVINVSFASRKLATSNGSPQIIDVVGLDEGTLKVLQSFTNGKFR